MFSGFYRVNGVFETLGVRVLDPSTGLVAPQQLPADPPQPQVNSTSAGACR
jgi:hypothetical protein